MNSRSLREQKRLKSHRLSKLIVFILCIGVSFGSGWESESMGKPTLHVAKGESTDGLGTKLHQETVDVLGGSAAHGWHDPNNNSYLRRAFSARSASTNTTYKYVDHTIVGESPYLLSSSKILYQSWLKKDKPQIVVISWGLLNSMHSRHKSTLNQFLTSVSQEISGALKIHAVVVIVTPPIVESTARGYHAGMNKWVAALLKDAESFHNKNVYTVNLYQQTQDYIHSHGQTVAQYSAGTWHPNQAGHILGGELLANDLVQTFGLSPITWK